MVLFVFATMMFNLNQDDQTRERQWLQGQFWLGPAMLAAILLIQFVYHITTSSIEASAKIVDAKAVGMSLFGPYLLAVEIASFLLLAGLVAAYHVAKNGPQEEHHG